VVEREPTLQLLRVIGVTREPAPREIALIDPRMIAPFDQCRLSTAFARTVNNNRRRAFARDMLRDLLTRYEDLRIAGRHDGPALQAVRLYRLTWTLDPAAHNIDHPDRADIIEEVTRDSRTAGPF
jgi:hypothetical protein